MGQRSQGTKPAMKSDKSADKTLTYDQLVDRVHVLEEGLRIALDNSMMPRQLIASLTALLPDAATGASAADSAAKEHRDD